MDLSENVGRRVFLCEVCSSHSAERLRHRSTPPLHISIDLLLTMDLGAVDDHESKVRYYGESRSSGGHRDDHSPPSETPRSEILGQRSPQSFLSYHLSQVPQPLVGIQRTSVLESLLAEAPHFRTQLGGSNSGIQSIETFLRRPPLQNDQAPLFHMIGSQQTSMRQGNRSHPVNHVPTRMDQLFPLLPHHLLASSSSVLPTYYQPSPFSLVNTHGTSILPWSLPAPGPRPPESGSMLEMIGMLQQSRQPRHDDFQTNLDPSAVLTATATFMRTERGGATATTTAGLAPAWPPEQHVDNPETAYRSVTMKSSRTAGHLPSHPSSKRNGGLREDDASNADDPSSATPIGTPPPAEAAVSSAEDLPITEQLRQLPRPSRPLTAYNVFFQHERRVMMESLPPEPSTTASQRKRSVTGIPFCVMGQEIGAKWKRLNEEDKRPFVEQAMVDQRRHTQEMKAYRAKKEELMRSHHQKRFKSVESDAWAKYCKEHGKKSKRRRRTNRR